MATTRYDYEECIYCGRSISISGLPASQHKKMHVRLGHLTTHTEECREYPYRVTRYVETEAGEAKRKELENGK